MEIWILPPHFSRLWKNVADEPRQHVCVQRGESSLSEVFPCDGRHRRIIGAELRRSQQQFEPFTGGHLLQLFTKEMIRRNSPPDR